MKKLTNVLLVSLVSLSFLFACKGKQEEKKKVEVTPQIPADAKYGVKSGIISYDVKMMGEQKQVLYFDEYGKKEARVTTMDMKIGKKKISSESVEITADGFVTRYDVKRKKGTKTEVKEGMTGRSRFAINPEKLDDEMKSKYKVKELGNKTILEKDCKGYSMVVMNMKMEVWMWNNLLIESKTLMSKKAKKPMVITATKIETDVQIPEDKFSVPQDVKITERKARVKKDSKKSMDK